jgi:hypothetical protein
LLSWAKPEYKESDKPLHETAMFLLHKLLALHNIDLPRECRTLKIKPQQNILPRIAR